MGRRRKWRTRFFESGVLVVDKPAGPTSHDVVARLRGRFGPGKIGHSGTLDPFATGVLVVAFNQATKLSDLLGAGGKKYQAGLVLGRCTDTGDLTGSETGAAPVPELDRSRVEQALAAMIGPRMQSPPAYSAAKHEGRPLYSYARDGKKVEKPPRPITIYDAALLDLRPGEIDFEMHCSRGAYIRTLGEDLAKDLGSVGHLQSLRRTASLPFGQDEAIRPGRGPGTYAGRTGPSADWHVRGPGTLRIARVQGRRRRGMAAAPGAGPAKRNVITPGPDPGQGTRTFQGPGTKWNSDRSAQVAGARRAQARQRL